VASPSHPLRGQVFEVELPGIGRKLWLVVSNNQRNRALDDVLAVRLTTSRKPAIPTVVELTPADGQFVGRILCDDIGPLYKDELGPPKGALSPATMRRVNIGLRAALATG
jgi:mRNA interferase MazF